MVAMLSFLLLIPTGTSFAAGTDAPALEQFSVQLGPRVEYDAVKSEWAYGDETLHWDMEPDRGFSIRGTYSYGCAQRYTETTGVVVKAILYYLTGSADAIFVYTAGAGTPTEPGPTLDTTRATGLGGGVWRRANMPRTPAIAPNQDFWACVIVRRHPADQSPLTLDLGPIVPYRGGYITLPEVGSNWYQLTDPPFWTDRNVNIRVVVQRAGTGVEEVISPTEPGPRHRIWPSPVRGRANISFHAVQSGPVTLSIYDAAGKLVRTLYNGKVQPGWRTTSWDCRGDDGRRVSPGTYLYRLTADGRTVTGKAVVLD